MFLKLINKTQKTFIFLFIIWLIAFDLHSIYSTETLTFFDILKNDNVEQWHGKQVTIRGFLYLEQNQLILAHEPNLRSCCIGKKEKQVSVFPKKSISKLSKRAITLQGRFVINNHCYSLYDAEMLAQ